MASYPAKIGKYSVKGVLGRGGMGIVYKAVDPGIRRFVAIKMILAEGDQGLLDRFRSEAQSTGALHCPNIVTVYDFGEHEGNPYLVMQYLEGTSLDAMIQNRVPLTIAEKLGIILDVCTGLAYAHQRGVIHRDIKPANIMVLQDGVNDGMGVIVDFGIARTRGATTRFTKTDHVIGSLHYMSPEHLEGEELDGRSDVYSTGVVLFQLLTGVLPFEAPEVPATLMKIINDPAPQLENYLKEYPIELEGILGRALAKKRKERYQTAGDFALDLMQVQERLKSGAVAQMVQRAEAAMKSEEWGRARELLQQALRIDRRNTDALKMLSTVQDRDRKQQRIEEARRLRSQADEAYQNRCYGDALRLIDRALTLDPQDGDLQSLRESIRRSKDRDASLQRALRRAETALHEGNLDEANDAIDEAFQIDPNDTQAKALKVIASRQAEEKLRRERIKKLLDEARRQIANHDLAGAFATLDSAKALDLASPEVQRVARLAMAAREMEERQAAAQELFKQIERALQEQDFETAVAKAEDGRRRFPQEQSFPRLKALAEGEWSRIQQKSFVSEQITAANSLAETGRLDQAVALLDRALQQLPRNAELSSLRASLRERLTAEKAEHKKLQSLALTLEEAKRLLGQQGAKYANEYLNVHARDYGDSQEFLNFYNGVLEREELDALNAKLAGEGDHDRKITIVEEALQNHPANGLIRQRLLDLQDERTKITAESDLARRLETEGRLAEAIQHWRGLATLYPQSPDFDLQANRLAAVLEDRQQPEHLPAPPRLVDSPTPDHFLPRLSATSVLDPLSTTPARPSAHENVISPTGTLETVLPSAQSVPSLWLLWKLRAHVKHFVFAATAAVLATAVYVAVGPRSRIVTVSMIADPAGTDILLGEQTCHAPCSLKLAPGKYELHAEHDGYLPLTESVSISTETKFLPIITLSPVPTPPPPEIGTLQVRSGVEGAEVYIDNAWKGVISRGEYEGKVGAGAHQVVVKKSGYHDSAPQRVEIASEKTSSITFELAKLPTTEAASYLVVQSQAGATVVVDQGTSSTVPEDGRLLQKVAPGSHSLSVSKPGYETWSATSTAESGKQITVMAILRENLPVPPIAPTITAFSSSVSSVEAGKSVTLSWQTQHADDVRIDPDVGPVGKSGSIQVSPGSDKTYMLTAEASGLSSTQRVRIAVKLPPPPPPKPDLEGVREGLRLYKEAYESMDIGEMKRAWPSLSGAQIKKLQNGFRGAQAVKVEPGCGEPSFQGDTATLGCAQTMTYTRDGKRQPKQTNSVAITMKKTSSGAWVVDKVLAN